MGIMPAEIHEQYFTLNKSTAECAEAFGVSAETFRRAMIHYGIPRRLKTAKFGGWNKGIPSTLEQRKTLSETRKAKFASGEIVHWNEGQHWPVEVRTKISDTLLGGRHPAPSYYGTKWHVQRTSCIQRDEYTCQHCTAERSLEVHHWEPFRFCFDNSLDNLVTLCVDCHLEIHKTYRHEGWIKEAEEAFYA